MPNSTQRPLKVFLCHSSSDKPIVRDLYRHLCEEQWIDVWLDEGRLLPGQEWDIEIEKAVEEADIVIVCLSTSSVDKEGYLQKELRFVLNLADEKPEGSIFVIPLRLDNCAVPRRLRHWQWVDYFPREQKSSAYQRLLESMKFRVQKRSASFDKLGPIQPKDEQKAEIQRLGQNHYMPEKKRVPLSSKQRLFVGVAGVLLLVSLSIMFVINYPIIQVNANLLTLYWLIF